MNREEEEEEEEEDGAVRIAISSEHLAAGGQDARESSRVNLNHAHHALEIIVEISKQSRDRIFAAADKLYLEGERRSFPTVDAVRKRALVNMNDASTAMREWRRLQTATLDQVPNQLPADLSASCTAALAGLWAEATSMANESLRGAQVGWDAERAEMNDLSGQMALAYDQQTAELELAQAEIAKLNTQIDLARGEITAMKIARDAAERERVTESHAAKVAETRALEIECRADALRTELARAHEEAGSAREELAACRVAHAEQMDQLRAQARRDVESERERSDSDRNNLEGSLRLALDESAELRGRLSAMLAPGTSRSRRTHKAPNGDGANSTKLDN